MMYVPGSPVEIQITAQWNLISHSVNALPPMLSPRNFRSPSFSHCAFIPARRNVAHALKKSYFIFLIVIVCSCMALNDMSEGLSAHCFAGFTG